VIGSYRGVSLLRATLGGRLLAPCCETLTVTQGIVLIIFITN
jgi:hypothetical protein